jgi:hypothetical protein
LAGLVPVRVGEPGSAVSTSNVTAELAALTFPAKSCTVAVRLYVLSVKANESVIV